MSYKITDEQISDLWSWSMTHDAEKTATTQQHAFARAIEHLVIAAERDRCAMVVWYKRQEFEASPDDDGVIHWLQEAEKAIRALQTNPSGETR